MDVLREIEKGVSDTELILKNDVENAKKYKERFVRYIDLLIQSNEEYFDSTTKNFEEWSVISVELFESVEKKTLKRLKRYALMMITDYYMNKLSDQLARSEQVQKRLETIKTRFDGFINLT